MCGASEPLRTQGELDAGGTRVCPVRPSTGNAEDQWRHITARSDVLGAVPTGCKARRRRRAKARHGLLEGANTCRGKSTCEAKGNTKPRRWPHWASTGPKAGANDKEDSALAALTMRSR